MSLEAAGSEDGLVAVGLGVGGIRLLGVRSGLDPADRNATPSSR